MRNTNREVKEVKEVEEVKDEESAAIVPTVLGQY
jgi:hypothetical protein